MNATDPSRPAQRQPAGTGLHLKGIAIHLGARQLVAVDTVVPPGGILTVMGPSGSGKSTLLSLINGTLAPAFRATGSVVLDGQVLDGLSTQMRRVGMLYQDDLLFPHLSVGGNLAFGLPASVRGRAARRARVEAALDDAGLAGHADRDPATLSGGQRARVSLMRVLLSEPRALLLDEPFSKLDTALKAQFRSFVFGEASRAGLPVVLVTHDHDDAAATGGPVIDLSQRGPQAD